MTGPAASIKARNRWWRYYVLDVEREKEVVKGALNSGKIVPWSSSDVIGKSIVALTEIVKTSSVVVGLNEPRYGIRSDGEMAAGLIQAASINIVNDVDTLVEIWGRVVDPINVPLHLARAKRLLNGLHWEMVLGGSEEGHYWQEGDYILAQQMHPAFQKGDQSGSSK
ncbi:hypothetical protein EV702DRAFT_1206803 [Suillus placidus]|uniref:Uncharacterized protein n=1 Tax=Suillus placidus TaxID=48579 RepID=A0A9P6ZF43_9AGAM|nr:hypothetical protein EV702DRAFT_1238286 [Suillus placidus]KAG1762050.1 hypothetical protein EV702DRAFT_1206803 [Suillus placidus]